MVRPYTWEEIKAVLSEELKKTRNIMTFGTIGSCNVEHDIDTIITKKPESKTSDFYKEVHSLFDRLDIYLKRKYSSKLIRFAFSGEEYLTYALAKKKKNDISFHVMIYTSYSQVQKDWGWALIGNDPIDKIIADNYKCLIGNSESLFSEDFKKSSYYDSLLIYLYLYDKLNSNLPEKVILNSMNHSFDYLFRKRLGLEAPIAKSIPELKKNFYHLCDVLDKLNEEKNK